MPRIPNLQITSGSLTILSGSLIISGSNGITTVLGSGSSNDFTGDVIVRSGSLTVDTGSISAQSFGTGTSWSATSGGTQTSGSVGVTGSLEVTGSVSAQTASFGSSGSTSTVTVGTGSGGSGALDVTGNSQFTGDVNIDGCFTINCCESLYDGLIGQVTDGTKSGSINYEIIALTESYGDMTSQLDSAAALGNGFIYLYSPYYNQFATYGYEGSNYNGVRTFITASGTNIPNGTILYIGQPGYNFFVEGNLYPTPNECTPIAEFCCDGITLYGDTTISGGLEVTGPTVLHDGLIITGCIEMLCPGDEATSYYGYGGLIRDTKQSGSTYQLFGQLDPSYGDVTFFLSQSADDNGGTLEVLNTLTGITSPYTLLETIYTGVLTRVVLEGDLIISYPPTSVVIGNINSILPGANMLMGSGSASTTSVATFCCDGINFNTDVTVSTGSVTVTGSVGVTGSVTIDGCVEISTSSSCDQVLFTGFDAAFRSSFLSESIWLTSMYVTTPPYGDITATLSSSAAANGGIVTLYNTENGTTYYVEYLNSLYNGYASIFQFTGNEEVIPNSSGYLVLGVNGTSPIGADITITTPGECISTVVICGDEVTIGTDVSVSGSVNVSGSITITPDPCPKYLGFDIFVKSTSEYDPGVYTLEVIFSPQYGDVQSILEASALSNGGKLLLTTPNFGFHKLVNFVSYNPSGNGTAILTSNYPIPNLTNYILADASGINLPSPADTPYFNEEACSVIPNYSIAVIGSDGIGFNTDTVINRNLVVGGNNISLGSTIPEFKYYQYTGYEGVVAFDGKEYSLYLDSRYNDVRTFLLLVPRLKFYDTTSNDAIYEDTFTLDFSEGQTIIIPDSLDLSVFDGLTLIAGISERNLVGTDYPVITENLDQAFVVGNKNLNTHQGTLLAGKGLTSLGNNTVAVGQYNSLSPETIFVVGNGMGIGTENNALEVTTSGSIAIPNVTEDVPSWTGREGEMLFSVSGSNYGFYVWLGGGWRSGSLS